MSRPAEVFETHVSIVMLLGDRAVKVKKPVRFSFIDLSTRELRHAACVREVELNRRLAPDVYLGVADVVGPDGVMCDHLVLMRRMPAERRLSSLARDGTVGDDEVAALARVLAAFHARADTSPLISASGRRDTVHERWEAGFAEMQPFLGAVIDPAVEQEIERLTRRYLAGREPLFDARIAGSRIVDGHGDLLASDIFLLPDGPRVLDCLEFDDALRHGDVVADIAFLAMDLERVGAGALAARFVAAYRELSGETHPSSLEHHYIAFRAHIRAKVACLRGDPYSGREARDLLDIALGHLRRGRVALTLVGGDPGSGKSTLATGIADHFGWMVLHSDEVRKDLAGISHTARTGGPVGGGIYDEETTAATYTELLDRARLLLELGESVVLDATWSDTRFRAEAAALADSTWSDLEELRCEAPAAVRETRVVTRLRAGTDPSDASVAVARALSARAEPWPTATTIDTTHGIEPSLDAARTVLQPD